SFGGLPDPVIDETVFGTSFTFTRAQLESAVALSISGADGDALRDTIGTYVTSELSTIMQRLCSSVAVRTLGPSVSLPRLDGSGTFDLALASRFVDVDATAEGLTFELGTTDAPPSGGPASRGVPLSSTAVASVSATTLP